MKANGVPITFLGESKELAVPFFQRHYVWKEENWQELLQSFQNTDTVPFLGSIILKDKGWGNFEIIDGQQRLTTITILAKALYLIHRINPGDAFFREIHVVILDAHVAAPTDAAAGARHDFNEVKGAFARGDVGAHFFGVR